MNDNYHTDDIMMRTRISGVFTRDLVNLMEHLNHFCDHYDTDIINCLEGIVDWRIRVSDGNASIDDLPRIMKIPVQQ
jgi:hypothetical protein